MLFRCTWRVLPPSVRIAVFLVVVGPTLYWTFSFSGPYRWLAEGFAASSSDQTYPVKLTSLLVALGIALPVMLLMRLLADEGVFGDPEQQVQSQLSTEAWLAWARARRWRLLFAGIGSSAVAFGAFLVISGFTKGPFTLVTAHHLENDAWPQSRWLEVTGLVLKKDALVVTTDKELTTWYAPLVSPGWKRGEPVAVYVQTHDDSLVDAFGLDQAMDEFQAWQASNPLFMSNQPAPVLPKEEKTVAVEGTASFAALPSSVGAKFIQAGLRPAARYVLLEHKRTPTREIQGGKVLLLIGAFLLLPTGLVWYVKARRRG